MRKAALIFSFIFLFSLGTLFIYGSTWVSVNSNVYESEQSKVIIPAEDIREPKPNTVYYQEVTDVYLYERGTFPFIKKTLVRSDSTEIRDKEL